MRKCEMSLKTIMINYFSKRRLFRCKLLDIVVFYYKWS